MPLRPSRHRRSYGLDHTTALTTVLGCAGVHFAARVLGPPSVSIAVQPACSDCPVYVLLLSPPARTAQCHPLPTSYTGLPRSPDEPVSTARSACSGHPVLVLLCSPRARAARCVCQCSVRLPGLPNASPPTIPDVSITRRPSPRSLTNRSACSDRPVLVSLCSPRARAAQCVCHCSVRLPGLPSAALPTCRFYYYTARGARGTCSPCTQPLPPFSIPRFTPCRPVAPD